MAWCSTFSRAKEWIQYSDPSHQPWRKNLLVALFSTQFTLTLVLSIWFTVWFVDAVEYDIYGNYDWYDSASPMCAVAVFNFLLLGLISTNFYKLARFRLRSKFFVITSSIAVLSCFITSIIRAANLDYISAPVLILQLCVSAWLSVYAVMVSRRIRKGLVGETNSEKMLGESPEERGEAIALEARIQELRRVYLPPPAYSHDK